MKKIGISELKASLNQHRKYVQQGHLIQVCDRGLPVAELVPLGAVGGLVVRPRLTHHANLGGIPLPRPVQMDGDPLEVLLNDRASGLRVLGT